MIVVAEPTVARCPSPVAYGATSYPRPSISCRMTDGVTFSGSNVTPTMFTVWSAVTDSTPSTLDSTRVTAPSHPLHDIPVTASCRISVIGAPEGSVAGGKVDPASRGLPDDLL